MKQLTNREKNRRKYLKIHHSLSNKMHDVNLIWWNSLTLKAQYSLVFKYITQKQSKDFKFKYFLQINKIKYKPSVNNLRKSTIDYILKDSKKQK